MAEAVFRHVAAQQGLERSLRIDSAGTQGYHIGSPPDSRAIRAAARRDISMRGLRARKIVIGDFRNYDLILAMDSSHYIHLQNMAPSGAKATLALLMDYAPGASSREIPDPYYGTPDDFDYALELIEMGVDGLIEQLSLALKSA